MEQRGIRAWYRTYSYFKFPYFPDHLKFQEPVSEFGGIVLCTDAPEKKVLPLVFRSDNTGPGFSWKPLSLMDQDA